MWDKIADEQDLREISRRLMDWSGDGYLVVDTNGTILYCNNSFLNYLGLRDDEVLGQNVRRLLHEVLIFNVMEHGESRVDTVGLVQGWAVRSGSTESNIHLISRYAMADPSGRVYAGVLCVKFRKALLDGTKKLYASFTDADFFQAPASNPSGASMIAVGRSQNFTKVKNMAMRAGNNDFPVLITGETGTGKEVIANLIHSSGKRADQPFIKINCAAIPSDLLESELFGYEPGAFTGASKTGKKGKFELANGGSIFLDEIGDMPLAMQAKLLRVLQEKEVEHIGGTKALPVDVRIMSATRRNLLEMIEKKEFREDLFFRLNVINIQIAPLRERKEDILLLAEHFLKILNSSYGTAISLPPGAAELLINYPWPGNARELNNVIQSAYAQTDSIELNLELFSANARQHKFSPSKRAGRTLGEAVEQFEREIITDTLRKLDYNLTAVSAELGIPRSSLYNKIKRYGIKT